MKRLIGAVIASVVSAGVSADPIITEWSVNQYSTFTAWTDLNDADPLNPPNPAMPVAPVAGTETTYGGGPSGITELNGGYDALAWGTPLGQPNQSGLFIGTTDTTDLTCADPTGACGAYTDAQIFTNGGSVETLTYNHQNNVISLDPNLSGVLETGTITGVVDLFADVTPDPGFEYIISDLATYEIKFFESPNSGTCNPAGTTICPDVVGIQSDDFVFNEFNNTATFQQVLPLGELGNYLVIVTLEDLQKIDDNTRCPENTDPCFGLISEEGALNRFVTTLEIRAIPAPAVPALMGLGLLALFGVRRRMAR